MTSLLVFLLALPLSVQVLAGGLTLLDGGNRIRALTGLALRLTLMLLLVVLTPATSRLWVGAAFVLVTVLHAGAWMVTRYAIRSGRWPTERI